MAFTYDELRKKIAESGQTWSEADQRLAQNNPDAGMSLLTAKNDWTKARNSGNSAAAADAHNTAEQIRRQYGSYSGGQDGSGYVLDSTYFNYNDPYKGTLNQLADKLAGYQEFANPYQGQLDALADQLMNYGKYENPYQKQTDAVLDGYLNRGPFSYDANRDPLWQQYQKSYLREGQRAREDTIGNYAAATGGQTSTAGMNAASQAQDYYNAQMADKIPELQQLAYSMYQDQNANDLQKIGALRGLNSDAMGAWQSNLGLLNNQLDGMRGLANDARNIWQDNLNLINDQMSGIKALSDTDYDRAFNKYSSDYNANRDLLSDSRYQDETSYNREYAKQQDAREQALKWLSAGVMPSSDVLTAGGISAKDAQAYINEYKAQQQAALAAKSSGGGGSSGSSSSKSSSTTATGQDYDGFFKAAQQSRDALAYLANNKKQYGFGGSSKTELKELYDEWIRENQNAGAARQSSARDRYADSGAADDYYSKTLDSMEGYAREAMTKLGNSPDKLYTYMHNLGYSDAMIDKLFARMGM